MLMQNATGCFGVQDPGDQPVLITTDDLDMSLSLGPGDQPGVITVAMYSRNIEYQGP